MEPLKRVSFDVATEEGRIELYHTAMRFPFYIGSKPEKTVERRIMDENTNDLGERVSPETAMILVSEFRKFMYVSALEILRNGHEGPFFKSPYCLPP